MVSSFLVSKPKNLVMTFHPSLLFQAEIFRIVTFAFLFFFQAEIFRLMKSDSYPRFLKSDNYKKILEEVGCGKG